MISRFVYGIGGTLITAAAGIYLFYGPSKKKSKDQCPGLENVGNSCFMNSLLQGWAACPSLYGWIKKSVNTAEERAKNSLLANTLYKILRVLNNEVEESSDPYNPSEVLYALRARGWVITGEEQDAHELFHVLTETLDEETARYPSIVSLFDIKHLQDPHNIYQLENEAVTRSRGLLPVLPARSIDQPTKGLLASQMQCISCGYRCPVRYDVFDSLSLSFSSNYWGSLSLDSLLCKFISPEIVQDVDCKECGKKKGTGCVKSSFQKRVSIGKLPQVLCLHLPRTHWMNMGSLVKRYDHVYFPEVLSMDPYLHSKQVKRSGITSIPGLMGGALSDLFTPRLSQNQNRRQIPLPNSRPVNLLRTLNFDQQMTQTGLFLQPQTELQIPSKLSDINHNTPPEALKKSNSTEFTYRLASVICHHGDALLGHFVAYRRGIHKGLEGAGDLGSRWWFTSDTAVKKVSKEEVLSSEAYMLFYERVPNINI